MPKSRSHQFRAPRHGVGFLGLRIFLIFLSVFLAESAVAQTASFGKNKIQYNNFDWRVLESDHFHLYYYPEEEELARTALQLAEDYYDLVAARFRHEVARRIPLIIYSSHQDFEQTNVTPAMLPEGVAGFTEFLKGRVAMPFNGSYHDFAHTLHHELVHVFQLSRLEESFRLHYRNNLVGPPLWFTEGMAEAWSEEWDATGDLFLRDLVIHDRLPEIRSLWRLNGTFVLYKVGQDLIFFLEENYGTAVVPEIYDELWRVQSFEEALQNVTGTTVDELSTRWHYNLWQRYFPDVQRYQPLELAARKIATKGASFKAVSPPKSSGLDPSTFYFLSPRTGYTNIYRASVNGPERDLKEIVSGQRKAEFESFHAFQSKIDVSSEAHLAFVSKFHERDGLFLFDLENEKLLAKWQFEALVALRSPAFHPDGTKLVFAGLSPSGRQDIYLFDLATETLTPLTDDGFLDDNPTWSPDGKRVLFVSDRNEWGKDGSKNLFAIDIEQGQLTVVTHGPWVDGAPAFNRDTGALAFSSSRNGTPQLFVSDSLGVRQVTNILGGATDPAWITGTNDLLFTGMSDLRFGIYRMSVPDEAVYETAPVIAESQDTFAEEDSLDWVFLESPEEETEFKWVPPQQWLPSIDTQAEDLGTRELPYRSRYTLDFAQGGVIFEPTQNVGEGIQGLLSDQLGDRLIFLQLSNTAQEFNDILGRLSFGATYFDLSQRINRGFSGFHFAGDFIDELGFRYFERRTGASVIASYPYSKYSRIESSLGLLYSKREADSFRPAREGLLAVNYLTLVRDTSLWSLTGPIDGARYNLTLGLTTNVEKVELENVVAMVDLRRYFRTSLRTAYAVRLQGRISQGSLPQRFILGGSWDLRGYPRRSLVGTRSLLLNQEWRFPLLYGVALGLPFGTIGFPPIEGAIFLDAAQAWEEGEPPDSVDGSFGLGMRTNLGGFLVLRLDLSRRTDFERIQKNTEVDFFVGFNY